jgi:hypothetical protein
LGGFFLSSSLFLSSESAAALAAEAAFENGLGDSFAAGLDPSSALGGSNSI